MHKINANPLDFSHNTIRFNRPLKLLFGLIDGFSSTRQS